MVDVEKLRRIRLFLASEDYDWSAEIAAVEAASAELEELRAIKAAGWSLAQARLDAYNELRAENAELNHVIAQNLATYRANTAELRATVEAIHELANEWWNHGDEVDALFAERLRAALRLLGRATETVAPSSEGATETVAPSSEGSARRAP